MLQWLRRLAGTDERSLQVEREHEERIRKLDETNRALEVLQVRLEKTNQATLAKRVRAAQVLESVKPREEYREEQRTGAEGSQRRPANKA